MVTRKFISVSEYVSPTLAPRTPPNNWKISSNTVVKSVVSKNAQRCFYDLRAEKIAADEKIKFR